MALLGQDFLKLLWKSISEVAKFLPLSWSHLNHPFIQQIFLQLPKCCLVLPLPLGRNFPRRPVACGSDFLSKEHSSGEENREGKPSTHPLLFRRGGGLLPPSPPALLTALKAIVLYLRTHFICSGRAPILCLLKSLG